MRLTRAGALGVPTLEPHQRRIHGASYARPARREACSTQHRDLLGGARVERASEHPDFIPTLLSWGGWLYGAAFDPETADTIIARPDLNGEDCHVFWHMATSPEDLLQNLKAAQLLAERSPLTGYASIGRDELHALLVATHDLDRARGTDYHQRVLAYVRRFQSEQLMTAAAVTDVKGHRGRRPGEQDDPDLYLRVVERRSDGIVVRGAKAHTSGSVGAEELIVIPPGPCERPNRTLRSHSRCRSMHPGSRWWPAR